MKGNAIISGIVGALIFGVAGVYVGATYEAGKTPVRGQFPQAGGAGAFAPGDTQASGRIAGGTNAVLGTIIDKDASSITVKLGGPGASSSNGTNTGSKIVLFDDSTEIQKAVSGGTDDLLVGESVTVNGSTNADGSISAKTIQLRPGIK